MTALTLPHPYATSPGAKIEHTLVSTSCQYGGDRYYNTMCGKHVHEEFIYFDDKTREPCFKCRQEQRKRERDAIQEAERSIRKASYFAHIGPIAECYDSLIGLRAEGNRVVQADLSREKDSDDLYKLTARYYTPEQIVLHQEDVDNARPSSHYEWYDWR